MTQKVDKIQKRVKTFPFTAVIKKDERHGIYNKQIHNLLVPLAQHSLNRESRSRNNYLMKTILCNNNCHKYFSNKFIQIAILCTLIWDMSNGEIRIRVGLPTKTNGCILKKGGYYAQCPEGIIGVAAVSFSALDMLMPVIDNVFSMQLGYYNALCF